MLETLPVAFCLSTAEMATAVVCSQPSHGEEIADIFPFHIWLHNLGLVRIILPGVSLSRVGGIEFLPVQIRFTPPPFPLPPSPCPITDQNRWGKSRTPVPQMPSKSWRCLFLVRREQRLLLFPLDGWDRPVGINGAYDCLCPGSSCQLPVVARRGIVFHARHLLEIIKLSWVALIIKTASRDRQCRWHGLSCKWDKWPRLSCIKINSVIVFLYAFSQSCE